MEATSDAARLLLVEDDEGIARPLTAALRGAGHDVAHLASGIEAVAAFGRAQDDGRPFHLVVLDLGLPDLDGLEVCREVRRRDADVPVLLLTARTSEADVVVGLDAGADDYVTKPFRLAELQARVRALLRRAEPAGDTAPSTQVLAVQDLRLDPAARRAHRDDHELDLTPREFDLLAELLANPGVVLTRDELMERVWQQTWQSSTKTLDVHVSSLRRKLGDDPASPRYVTTVRGVGLRMEADDPAG